MSNITVKQMDLTFSAKSAFTGGPNRSEIWLNGSNRSLGFIEKISKDTSRFLGRPRNVVANLGLNLKCVRDQKWNLCHWSIESTTYICAGETRRSRGMRLIVHVWHQLHEESISAVFHITVFDWVMQVSLIQNKMVWLMWLLIFISDLPFISTRSILFTGCNLSGDVELPKDESMMPGKSIMVC